MVNSIGADGCRRLRQPYCTQQATVASAPRAPGTGKHRGGLLAKR